MKKLICLFLMSFSLMLVSIAQDVEKSKDPSLFTRMPNYYINSYEEFEFDKFDFPVSDTENQSQEGHLVKWWYYPKEGTQPASSLQILRNYQNAIKKVGGQVIYEYTSGEPLGTMKLIKNGNETWIWIRIMGGSNGYGLAILEKQSMNQDVVADARTMATSISETGKVALYGIYFDSGKADLKKESASAMQEIARSFT
jgi:OmpA-OmpF porin, OOP family